METSISMIFNRMSNQTGHTVQNLNFWPITWYSRFQKFNLLNQLHIPVKASFLHFLPHHTFHICDWFPIQVNPLQLLLIFRHHQTVQKLFLFHSSFLYRKNLFSFSIKSQKSKLFLAQFWFTEKWPTFPRKWLIREKRVWITHYYFYDHFEMFLKKIYSLVYFSKEEVRSEMSINRHWSEYSSESKSNSSS